MRNVLLEANKPQFTKMMTLAQQRDNYAPDGLRYRIELDGVMESEWTGLVDRFQDANIYQTWSYGAIRWGEKHLSHLILRRDDEVVAIAQLRIVHFSPFKSGVAYLRWGPLCHMRGREFEPEILRQMALALHNEYVLKRGLLLRVLPDAFAGSQRAELFQTVFSQLAAAPWKTGGAERTFLLDLTPSLEELRKNLDQKWRNQLNRAEKNGLSIKEGTEHEDFQVFAGIYRSMRSRKKFDTTVDVDEFACIQRRLPATQRMKIMICLQQGIPVAGIVCSAMGDSAIYLLGATGENGLNAKGTYLLQWTMIKWLKENGFHYYDLGGIDPEGNPGVYHFKRGLSGRDVFRIGQFNLCENFLSSVLMQAGDFVRRRRQMSFAGRPAQDLSGACGATHTGIPQ